MTKNGNGDGSVYQRSDGRWVAALQIGFKANGKQDVRTCYAKTEPEAKRKLREMKKTAYQETPEQRKKQTVEQYMWAWFKRYKNNLKPAAYDRQEETIKYQVLPFLGQYQIHAVVASDIKDLMNWLQDEKGYAHSTVKKAYDACNECFRQAVEDGLLAKNPCNKQNRPMKADFLDLDNEDTGITFLDDDEIARFSAEAKRVYGNGKMVYRLGYGGKFIPIQHEYLLLLRKDAPLVFPVLVTQSRTLDIRDMPKATWKDVVAAVIAECGGQSDLDGIYAKVEGYKRTQGNEHWREKIRQTLQRYTNLFLSPQRGVWRLKEA